MCGEDTARNVVVKSPVLVCEQDNYLIQITKLPNDQIYQSEYFVPSIAVASEPLFTE